MQQSNFFRLLMPYGIDFYFDGLIQPFNRSYLPLESEHFSFDPKKKLDFLKGIAHKNQVQEYPGFYRIWLYDDVTNPSDYNRKDYWEAYFLTLKELSKIKSK